MKLEEMRGLRFSTHFLERFVERFGKKYGITMPYNRSFLVRRLFSLLSEATPVLPTDPYYEWYMEQKYEAQTMVKGCGIVFFIRDNCIVTCIPVKGSEFQKQSDPVIVDKPFSLGTALNALDKLVLL